MGSSWVQPSDVQDVSVAWRRSLKKIWVIGIEVSSFDYLVVSLEREELMKL